MILINGDCIEEMHKLIDDGVQVDSVVTDPPYHLTSIVDRFGKKGSAKPKDKDGLYNRIDKGFMGQEWDGGDIAFQQETWELAYKLLKPGGHLLAFSASRNYHRMAVAIEDAGFDIRDQIIWLYGSGFPKSHNIGKDIDKKQGNSEWEGWGTALKPAHEPIVMARKSISEKSIADNVLKYRTGAINIDECRVEGNDAKYPDSNPDFKDIGRQSKEAIGIDKLSFGQTENAKRKRAEGIPDGRFPANVMHNGLDTEWSRYFYCPKASKSERNNSTVKNNHPTVKPQKLMQYLCRMVTPKGGIVLDMFMGSGSTGMAAKDEGFDFIGIEKEKEYFKIAEARIESVEVKATLQEFME